MRGAGAVGLALAVVVLLQPMLTPVRGDSKKMSVEPRALVRAVTSKYVIYQGDDEIGAETVTCSEFNDNSIQYQSKIEIEFPQISDMVIETDLLLEEESRFPMHYDMVKHVKQGQVEYDMVVDIDWFANVAVISKQVRAAPETTRVVLPTGTAVLDINAIHQLYVPLYWYDEAAGGYQNFNVLEPMTGRLTPASLRRQVNEMVAVGGEEVAALRYEITREKQTFTLHVDEEGRIVKVDQGFMVYELAEHTETSAGE
jgi:hypothetical protein